ncbi:MAG TPA: hypothetical protein VGS78_17575 [Candidatus Sulfotelmatobacter sp.]|nr:hypothetical protein [Candidatus Sulfotelmatobacter sp.]
MKGFLVILVTAFVMTWMISQARTAAVRVKDGTWILNVVVGVRIVWIAVLALGLSLIVAGLRQREDRILLVVMGTIFSGFTVITWPKNIEILQSGLQQRNWYGKKKFISWREITEVVEKRDGTVIVKSERYRIEFSAYHVGRDTLLSHLKKIPKHDKEQSI